MSSFDYETLIALEIVEGDEINALHVLWFFVKNS